MTAGRGAVRRPQLTERDKQLIGYLGVARYLSTDQVLRLFFPGRDKASSQRRLLRLAGEWGRVRGEPQGPYANFEPPYLRRLFYRTYDGDRIEVWGLTEIGYAVASKVVRTPLRVPAADVGANFLEHSIQLNDVLVSIVDPAESPCGKCGARLEWVAQRDGARGGSFLLKCAGTGCRTAAKGVLPRIDELPFRWTGPEGARLPWKDYDRAAGATRDRVIVPDGVVELPSRRARLFLEFETGSQSVVAPADRKPGATTAKLERYADFLFGFADGNRSQTNYTAVYADNWEPTVIFVVVGDARRRSVEDVIAIARRNFPRLSARALLPAEVVSLVRGAGKEPLAAATLPRGAEELVLPGRLSVRAEFLLDVADCLRELARGGSTSERLRAVLRVAEVYADRAAAARPVG